MKLVQNRRCIQIPLLFNYYVGCFLDIICMKIIFIKSYISGLKNDHHSLHYSLPFPYHQHVPNLHIKSYEKFCFILIKTLFHVQIYTIKIP